jgi:hypothetical protein
MTEYCAVATGEDCRQPPPASSQPRMPDGIYTAMHAMQPTLRQARVDRAFAQSQRFQLSPSDDAVLTIGQFGDLCFTWST